MLLTTIDKFSSFKETSKLLWEKCWSLWYNNFYVHSGIKEYLRDEIISHFGNQKINVLDAGCGSAWVAKEFVDIYDSYTGLDFNTNLINQLKVDFKTYTNCKFHEFDFEGNDILENVKPFDLILANFLVIELTNINGFFEKCKTFQTSNDLLIVTALDPVNEIVRASTSESELNDNLSIYRHSTVPIVIKKKIKNSIEESEYNYLRILYSIKDILKYASMNGYELIDLDDKLNLLNDNYKSPLYFSLILKKK